MPHNVDVKVSTELNEELLDQKLIAGDLLRCGSCPVVVSFQWRREGPCLVSSGKGEDSGWVKRCSGERLVRPRMTLLVEGGGADCGDRLICC